MKILVPVDGSETSLRALKHALELVKAFSKPGKLTVVAVDDALFPGAERKIGADAVREHHAENFARMFAPAKKALARSKANVAFTEVVDDIASGILKAAHKEKSDLIVMGSRGAGGIKGTLLGSVSMKVLASSPVPVTIVR
ncbi:MAG TPA: universal stress protein [Luteimonas sp.]|nr:universal stress protein [Luteimonas sp.]HRO26268.1 universal stress protein [Luteimonas sp.]HRP71032.1 universal stress protein [Luteimonas sp.]